MTGLRLLYGLDRLPSTLAADDARLPAVDLGTAPLRLNSVPLPAAAWGAGGADHAARIVAVRSWLLASCGDYNGALRRGITHYLDAVAAHVTHHRDILATGLAPFQGLYRVEDWCWSALRPLPRAWWQRDGAWQRADLAFWNGSAVIAVRPQDFESGDLPVAFQHFWEDQTLPVSPFRRAFPAGPDEASLRPSSP
jgi:hypothetical protein